MLFFLLLFWHHQRQNNYSAQHFNTHHTAVWQKCPDQMADVHKNDIWICSCSLAFSTGWISSSSSFEWRVDMNHKVFILIPYNCILLHELHIFFVYLRNTLPKSRLPPNMLDYSWMSIFLKCIISTSFMWPLYKMDSYL